jgi:hypothetical protein
MHVVYFFVENCLPWTGLIDMIMSVEPHKKLYTAKNFRNFRLLYHRDFQKELGDWMSPFGDIFKYLYKLIKKSEEIPDYQVIIDMLPSDLSMN